MACLMSSSVERFNPFAGQAPCRREAIRVLIVKAVILAVALLALLALPTAAKNMFYLLAAKWCDEGGGGPTRFEISEDGSLIYDPAHGRTCQISSATNMDQPSGTYRVTWHCKAGMIKERLFTTIEHDKNGNRHFLLKRNGKTYEQCSDQDDAGERPR
jgi:hypothetical protein